MKYYLVLAVILIGLALSVSYGSANIAGADGSKIASAQEKIVDAENAICPVCGNPVSGKDSVVYNGKRYGLCCPHCAHPFLNESQKYISSMEKVDQGIVANETKSACPVCGSMANAKNYVEKGGKKYEFCCESCMKKFSKDPSKFTK